MNKIISIKFFGMLAVMLAFAACNKDDNPPTYSSLGDVVQAGSSFFIQSDKGNKLLIDNTAELKAHGVKDGDRLFTSFLLTEKEAEGYNEVIDIHYFYKVLVKDPVALTAENAEQIGDDKISLYDIWCSDHYLNIQYQFLTDGSEAHVLNLVTVDEPKKEDDGYLYMEFRHNAKSDPSLYPYNGIVSFRIDELKAKHPDMKGLYVRVRTMLDGEKFIHVDFQSDDKKAAARSLTKANLSEVPELAQ